eukprot:765914_1
MSWKELTPAKTDSVRPQLIQMEDCFWWSTDYDEGEQAMVQYDIQSDKIISVIKYPNNIKQVNYCHLRSKSQLVLERELVFAECRCKRHIEAMLRQMRDIGYCTQLLLKDDSICYRWCYVFNPSRTKIIFSVNDHQDVRTEDLRH